MTEELGAVLGCGLVLAAFVCVLSQFPGVVLVLGVVILLATVGAAVGYALNGVTSKARNGFIKSDDPNTLATRRAVINRLRRIWRKPPILVVPKSKIKREEQELAERANVLIVEIQAALEKSTISPEKKTILMRQVRAVPASITEALWRLYRLRKLQELPYDQNHLQEAADLEAKALATIQGSVDGLMAMPLSLMRLEMAQADGSADRFIAELSELNKRLRDQTDAYLEVHSKSVR